MSETPSPDAVAGRGAMLAARILLVLATVLTVVAIFALWVNRQALDTNDWTRTSTRLLQDSRVRSALSTYLVDQLYANVDVAGELRKLAPKDLRPLAGPAAGGLRDLLVQAADQALQLPRVQDAWRQANRVAHKQFVAVVEGKQQGVVTVNQGEVALDLRPLVGDLAQRVGVGDVASKLPPAAGHLRILRSDQIKTAQRIAQALRGLVVILLILVPVLYASAVVLARGRRRQMVMAIGFCFIAAGLVVLIVRGLAGDYVAGALTNSGADRPAADAVWSIGTSVLVDVAQSSIVVGIPFIAAAWLAGPTKWAASVRRVLAGPMAERPVYVWSVVAVILLLLVVWEPIRAFRNPFGLLLIIVLVVGGIELLRRQIAVEYPDARAPDVEEWARNRFERLRAAAGRMRRGARARMPAPAPTQEAPRVEQLERLAALHERGALTDEEFAEEKAALRRGGDPGGDA
ncbi:MAG TPA: SHOCT domain-containing protein [Solirubrobacteraceae bacterium]|nr:SHOCT domain-containing protein [Solirubrobacteraceae bacterium]